MNSPKLKLWEVVSETLYTLLHERLDTDYIVNYKPTYKPGGSMYFPYTVHNRVKNSKEIHKIPRLLENRLKALGVKCRLESGKNKRGSAIDVGFKTILAENKAIKFILNEVLKEPFYPVADKLGNVHEVPAFQKSKIETSVFLKDKRQLQTELLNTIGKIFTTKITGDLMLSEWYGDSFNYVDYIQKAPNGDKLVYVLVVRSEGTEENMLPGVWGKLKETVEDNFKKLCDSKYFEIPKFIETSTKKQESSAETIKNNWDALAEYIEMIGSDDKDFLQTQLQPSYFSFIKKINFEEMSKIENIPNLKELKRLSEIVNSREFTVDSPNYKKSFSEAVDIFVDIKDTGQKLFDKLSEDIKTFKAAVIVNTGAFSADEERTRRKPDKSTGKYLGTKGFEKEPGQADPEWDFRIPDQKEYEIATGLYDPDTGYRKTMQEGHEKTTMPSIHKKSFKESVGAGKGDRITDLRKYADSLLKKVDYYKKFALDNTSNDLDKEKIEVITNSLVRRVHNNIEVLTSREAYSTDIGPVEKDLKEIENSVKEGIEQIQNSSVNTVSQDILDMYQDELKSDYPITSGFEKQLEDESVPLPEKLKLVLYNVKKYINTNHKLGTVSANTAGIYGGLIRRGKMDRAALKREWLKHPNSIPREGPTEEREPIIYITPGSTVDDSIKLGYLNSPTIKLGAPIKVVGNRTYYLELFVKEVNKSLHRYKLGSIEVVNDDIKSEFNNSTGLVLVAELKYTRGAESSESVEVTIPDETLEEFKDEIRATISGVLGSDLDGYDKSTEKIVGAVFSVEVEFTDPKAFDTEKYKKSISESLSELVDEGKFFDVKLTPGDGIFEPGSVSVELKNT